MTLPRMCVLCGSHDHMAEACFWRPGWHARRVTHSPASVHTFVHPAETIDVRIDVTTTVTPTVQPDVT